MSGLLTEEESTASLRSDLAAANARVAELEREKADERRIAGEAWARIREVEQTVYAQGVALDAANARAEAAERGEKDAVAALDANWVMHQRVVRAESEAAELLAEVERLADARGEREARVLTAEARAIGLESRLAAANALLEYSRSGKGPWASDDEFYSARDAHLSGQATVPTERAAAERAVLEACAGAHDDDWAQRVWWAELARRAVAGG